MPGISPTGNGSSSIDVKGLVNKLIKAEGAPTLSRLDQQEAKIQSNISALGAFRSAVSDFQNTLGKLRSADDMHKMAATSSDKDKIDISASTNAQEGNYNVEALQLAQSQRLTSEAFASDLEPMAGSTRIQENSRLIPRRRSKPSKSRTKTIPCAASRAR